MVNAEFCATCFKEEGKEFKGKLIGGVCPDCYKNVKGKDSVSEEGMPQFASMEELETFLKNAAKTEGSQKPEKTKKKQQRPFSVDVAMNVSDIPDEEIYQTNHLYVRKGDTIEALRKDAKEERKIRNSNILIYIHDHIFGVECNKQCKEVT